MGDIARAHILAMERGRPGETYMIPGDPASLLEVLRDVARIADTKGPVSVPAAFIRGAAAVSGLVGKVVPLPALYRAETLHAALASYLGTRAKAERELGWHPRPIDEGLADTVAALRAAP